MMKFLLVSVLFSLLISNSLSTFQVYDSHPSSRDAQALISLKQGFLSPDPILNSWNESNIHSLCYWKGIRCDHFQRVVSVDLSNSNIFGVISPSIGNLEHLVNLSLAGNAFSGNFPLESGNLTSLRSLNISNNSFNGSLDLGLFSLLHLEVLDVYNNNLSGPLPQSVAKLKKLKHLDLGGNYFSGAIPPSYAGLKELEFLSLAGNDLSGVIPGEIGELTNLKQLFLGYFNDFDGGIPLEIGNLTNLLHLDLSSCGLEGEIPKQLGNLWNLDTLFLQTNLLSGPLPPQLGNLTRLKSLDISNNEITGEIPIEFSNLTELALINLFINKLHGDIPDFVSKLPNLEVLKLWQNNLTGAIPSELGSNGRLKELDLSSNRLTGLIPQSLCSGRTLRILILLNNFLFGMIPEDLGNCLSLSRVRLSQNFLSGSVPKGFLYLPELSLMELQNNYLTGNFPDEHTRVAGKLGQLNLSNNRLSGPLPLSIGNFPSLQILLLSGNQFTGSISSEVGRLQLVLKIDLSKNNFSGEIPADISKCLHLTYLDLSTNMLSGPIPAQLSEIHILNYLNLSHNILNDAIPKEIGTMKSLTAADFSYNDLSGKVPESGQFTYFNSTSFQGNPQLCGPFVNRTCVFPANPTEISVNKPRIQAKFKLIFALGLLICSLIFVCGALIRTRTLRFQTHSRKWKLTAFQKLDFGVEDILECLKDNNVIGRGGAGVVYKGTTRKGTQIAVKKLLGFDKDSYHDNGFSAEIRILGQIRHRNIVRLLAFCSNKETNLLVYEYMPEGSLGEVLHGSKGGFLDWQKRVKIGIEAARGLCYLHHDCNPLVLHRDVKSNNILLDSELEAHVADFGLAKFLLDNGTSECMSAIAGSYGYIAPEYAYTLKVDEKSDVYSFGVVLVELITGRRPVGEFGDGVDIVQWAKSTTSACKEGVFEILDSRLKDIPIEEAKHVFFVAMLCVQEQSVERPTMREVVHMLQQTKSNHNLISNSDKYPKKNP
ncbi:leucine-rich repeat receptor-like serine/threonine-protein kinase BAM3 [Amborella trichopoda]|uniref:leucine-rich repeat receptor-like serine/threonine-protein kinase BAM3 n=1 Tax=Amborella trichopoda TaxID=13333 RepID=UPI0009C0D801|nr:leucine-rich repeat receptor-like serine/threonine-protein kinase BAM3 [Amborella trichopoda]|eukprot:XP_011628818.2 leucine-rich repeat receptor-like serine/threonine-protein kinase BAM3 [Amborella trichopoda]